MLSPPKPDPTSKAPAVKRSLFNKPSWSRSQPIGDAVDIFRRSDQTYADIVAEEEKKRNRKLARKEKERAKQYPDVAERAGKRRRISDYSDDDDGAGLSGSSASEKGDKPLETARKCTTTPPGPDTAKAAPEKADREDSPKSLLKRYESTVTAEKVAQDQKPQAPNIIDLDDEEDDPGFGLAQDLPRESPQAISQKPPEIEDPFPSDEEFPELARRAREKAKLKRMEKEKQPSAALDSPALTTTELSFEGTNVRHIEPMPPPPPPDPIVNILITSQIANTKPLIINRRLTQRLKDVRVTWCQRQGFNAETAASIFLTWRGKRLFDVTTCKSLGIGVDADGNVSLTGQRDALGEDNRQLHMEAMTDEIMDGYKRAKNASAMNPTHNDVEEIAEPPKQPQGTKIILRSKDYEDFKLIVKAV